MATANGVRSDAVQDPRPLRLEPLPLDLLNTTWIDGGREQDLLATVDGTAIWLESADLDPRYKPDRIDEADQRGLRVARDAIRAVATDPQDLTARAAFNALLARGHRMSYLGEDGPATRPVVDEPHWLVPWLAAEAHLDLLRRLPDRIRRCQHPDCVLWYLDTSPAGSRRWCSMTLCGNRAKAGRHYQKKPR